VLDAALAGGAVLVAAAFALTAFDRWHRRGTPHDHAFGVSMTLFALGALAFWWAGALGWSMPAFRVFFLAGAVLNVAWLGLGNVYLVAGVRLGDRLRTWLLAASAFAVGVVAVAPTRREIGDGEFPAARELFGTLPRTLAAVGSGVPALFILGAALWSAARVMRGRAPALAGVARTASPTSRLALGNVLVAVGTLVLSASGTLAGRLGRERAFAVTLVVGVCLLFAGYLVAVSRPAATPPPRRGSPASTARA
jgi:hypothetical protein